jgi:large subunit ribosomal protein L10
VNTLAFSKQQKSELQMQYSEWLKKSQACFAVSYTKMTVKEIQALRAKARETGSELHVVKNTLIRRALVEVGIPAPEFLDGTSLIGFAFTDPPSLAKVLSDAAKNSEVFAIKGGLLGNEELNPAQVKSLAELPPLPIMRAKLLGLFTTPATQLVRTLAEPARRLAYVVKAHSEQGESQAA